MSVITSIKRSLGGIGYTVEDTPQEKTYDKLILILIDQMSINVETQTTYIFDVGLKIKFTESKADSVPTKIATVMKTIEDNLDDTDAMNFQFTTVTTELHGQNYYISIGCKYMEVIQID